MVAASADGTALPIGMGIAAVDAVEKPASPVRASRVREE